MPNFRSVALIGSSGGGTATLGHTDPLDLLRSIENELAKANASLDRILFVACGRGMDMVDEKVDQATLYTKFPQKPLSVAHTGTLEEVNQVLKRMDEQELATVIHSGKVNGLICVSCSVNLHASTLQAAAQAKIPVTGSGGTSLAAASARFGIRLVGNAGGSVANTTYTRAVSYTYALMHEWKQEDSEMEYRLSHGAGPQWTSVLNACLPAFWAVCLTKRFAQTILPVLLPSRELSEQELHGLTTFALPMACSVVMASSQAPHLGSTVIMAASVAATLGCHASVLAGMFAGGFTAALCERALHGCIRLGVPATMTNLLVGGGVGSIVGAAMLVVSSYLRLISEMIRNSVHWSMNGSIPGLAFLIGCLFCYGSKVGYYHALCLPVILVEMEHGDASVWGTIDEATLVVVSAGICTANLLLPLQRAPGEDTSSRQLCQRGLITNLLFGDFIEVAYPFMEASTIVNVSGYLASGIATELMAGKSRDVLGLAYLPLPLSVWLAADWQRACLVYTSAFVIAFAGALIANVLESRQGKRDGNNKRD